MCPPVTTLRDGNGSDKTGNGGQRRERAAVGAAPAGAHHERNRREAAALSAEMRPVRRWSGRVNGRWAGRRDGDPYVAGFGLPPINAVGAATPGGPRCDDLPCRLNGITFHIPRRGGPMCPPVARCGTGTVPIKRYMSVNESMGRRGRRPVRRCMERVNKRKAGRRGRRPLRRITQTGNIDAPTLPIASRGHPSRREGQKGALSEPVPIKRARPRHVCPSYGGDSREAAGVVARRRGRAGGEKRECGEAANLFLPHRAIFSGGMYVGKNFFCHASVPLAARAA